MQEVTTDIEEALVKE